MKTRAGVTIAMAALLFLGGCRRTVRLEATDVTPAGLADLRAEFNRAAGVQRVILLISPS